jgi:hypothetical protein
MRYAKTTLVALVTALALVLPMAATADPPVKEPTPVSPVSLDAGLVCPFAVTWTFPADGNFQITHTDSSGGVRWIWGGGHNVTRVTNVSNGKSVDINSTGPGKITSNDDGSFTLAGSGHWLVGYFPTDNPAGPRTVLYSGNIVLHVAPDGQLTLVSYNGTAPQDVCAMVA